MFYSGAWYKNSDKQEGILKDKLAELLQHKQELDHQQRHQTETILNREATSAGDDEQFMRENKKRLSEVNAKINVLTNAIHQMGFKLKPTTNVPNINGQTSSTKLFHTALDSLRDTQPASLSLSTDAMQSALQQFSSHFSGQPLLSSSALKFPPFVDVEGAIKDTDNNAIQIVPLKLRSMISPRIQSSHFDRRKEDFVSALNEQYENELQIFRTRRNQRLRYEVNNRIYHIDPDITQKERYKKTDNTPLSGSNGHYIEHIWVETIDDALQSYIEGDVLELAEGRHVVAGTYKIYGTLTVRGSASSNWKTLIENKTDSQHFIWCIGSSSRVKFENVLLRSYGSHSGIVRVSLRAQFIARKVLFHCGGLEGISLEHGSKLWLDGCVLLNAVGAGIHVNTGCKCLLTQSTILNCGEGDHELMHGQGAIVIYGTDINYAEHLVRKTPPLRFPSMDNVPKMVLDPDTTLASMLRGRTYLYVQECKIKSNFGFGISFEVTSAFHPLPVPAIASMMDVSITVRETHFTENSFGNMGKIPAHWIQHNKEEQMTTVFNAIKRINPQLFGPVHNATDAEEDEDEEMKDDASNHNQMEGEFSAHSPQIMPLTEQALRARNESDECQSNGSSVQIITIVTDDEHAADKSNDENMSGLRSNRSKSEPPAAIITNTPKKNKTHTDDNDDDDDDDLHQDLEGNDFDYLSLQAIDEVDGVANDGGSENVSSSIKLSDKREEEFSLGSNLSEKIVKMRQTRGTLRLSAPPPPTTLLSASASVPLDHEESGPITKTHGDRKGNKSKEEIDIEENEDVDIAIDSTVSTPCHHDINEANTNSNSKENDDCGKPLRRSSRIKDKQQKLEKLQEERSQSHPISDELQLIQPNQPKQTKAAYQVNTAPKTKRVVRRGASRNSLPIAKIKKQIKSKKRRRCSRNRSKSSGHKPCGENSVNDEEDDKENDHVFVSTESPSKRRRLNEGLEGNTKRNWNENKTETETERETEIRFPTRRNTEELELQLSENENEEEDDDMNMTQNVKLELRRSTRKASKRATKNLSNLMKRSKRKAHVLPNKTVLSQNAATTASNKRRPQRKRRHSASKR